MTHRPGGRPAPKVNASCHTHAVPYDPDTYKGSAVHYRRGRPPYSPALEAVLTEEMGLDGSGRLMDVGCGPGVLTTRLAPLFEDVAALDPDADMLAAGRRAASASGLTNIHWVQALAEDLPVAAPGPYRLITFGQSFHWTQEQLVAEIAYDLLEPGGVLALIVHTVAGRPQPPNPGLPPIPHEEIGELVQRYVGSTQRAGRGTTPDRTHRFEDILMATRFGASSTVFAPGIPDLSRDSESVLSGYFSLSWSAPHLFGNQLEDFAEKVRQLLAARSPQGLYWDWPGDTEIVMAHKPA
jgi:SAM-dependent methyltransferase